MRKKEFELYPKYKEIYIRTFDKMLARRKERSMPIFDAAQTGEDLFDWWISN